MVGSQCRVSSTDESGILHRVTVESGSLYEAVALAVAQLRDDEISPAAPNPNTEFTVEVYRAPTEHRLKLKQVLKWAEPTTKERPAGITRREKVRSYPSDQPSMIQLRAVKPATWRKVSYFQSVAVSHSG